MTESNYFGAMTHLVTIGDTPLALLVHHDDPTAEYEDLPQDAKMVVIKDPLQLLQWWWARVSNPASLEVVH